eukprot:TRINITY_DN2074_c0_g1_i4.p1 TRINITY_DN2074_c0_g1~~TRINITY_DN2074_c0_g1_i4.p1  ORF type:complete len:497 (+),score=88.48 TRINITY_DN2074_c0_g1_i4:95-1492(+)
MRSLLLLSAALHASCEVYENLNNVVGVSPGKDVEGVNKYLGKTDSMDRCMSVGKSYAGVTYFNSTYSVNEDFRDMCYGVNTSLSWNPTPQQGAWSTWDHQSIETPCETNDDCSRNGNCVNGFCSCFPQWTGAHCSVLNFLPAESSALGFRVQNDSSWGGSVLYDETDGLYHMWAAEMVNSCGIRVWKTNMQIRHSTSPDPLTVPFTPKEVTVGLYSTEPLVARIPKTGQFAMWYAAMFPPNIPCTNHTCDKCSMGSSINDGSCPNDQHCNHTAQPLELQTYMSYANSSSGPWSEPQKVPYPPVIDTNLAPIVYEDGSLVGLGRPPHMWRSDDWKNISKYEVVNVANSTLHGEDPFLYLDHEGVLHALFHGGGWMCPFGLHVWSNDKGMSWNTRNNIHAYDSKVTYKNGLVDTLSRRERPHLVFAKDDARTPIGLTNGVTAIWPCDSPNNCPTDASYTSLQPLNFK